MSGIRGIGMVGGTVAVLLCGGAVPLHGQSIAERVAATRDGKVRMTYAARPGVCGNGHNISISRDDDEWESDCEPGPVRVVLTLANGAVTHVETYVGGRWRPEAPGVDLGTVSAAAAAEYLLGLRMKGAIFPATLADSVTVWPRLLALARDSDAPHDVRHDAVFWLGQAAGDAVVKDLAGLANQPNADRDVQDAAVFALSQLKHDAGVPALIEIAKTHRDPAIRKRAMFWLGQSGDPRALQLFETILTQR